MRNTGGQQPDRIPTPEASLRAEQPTDVDAVAEVLREAFVDEPQLPQLVQALRPYSRQPGQGAPRSFVAVFGGTVVGFVMLSRCHIDAWQELVPALVLGPLAVRPEAEGRGLGSALVDMAVRAADQELTPAVFLEGSPAFYRRRGFEAAEPLGFRRPSLRTPAPAFQVHRLSAYQPWMTGTIVYPQPFWDWDAVGFRDRDLVQRIELQFG